MLIKIQPNLANFEFERERERSWVNDEIHSVKLKRGYDLRVFGWMRNSTQTEQQTGQELRPPEPPPRKGKPKLSASDCSVRSVPSFHQLFQTKDEIEILKDNYN